MRAPCVAPLVVPVTASMRAATALMLPSRAQGGVVSRHGQRRAVRAVVGRAASHELHDFAPWPADRLDDADVKQGAGGEIDVLNALAVVHHHQGIGSGIESGQQQRIRISLRQLTF